MTTKEMVQELVEFHGAYFNEEEQLWHLPLFSANSGQEHFFGMYENGFMEGTFKMVVENFNAVAVFEELDMQNNDEIEMLQWEKDVWYFYNKRNNICTWVDLSTSIGADDGHMDFVNGIAYTFKDFGNFEFIIPNLYNTEEEMVQENIWKVDDSWI